MQYTISIEKSEKIYALIDCNNFYASCEAVFNPKLRNKPLVILSNNDGCIVARSAEAKKLDFKFGLPFFKHKDLIKKHNVNVLSSNYALYGDMSKRVMNTISLFSPDVEIYSIDEAFVLLNGFENRNLTLYGHNIRNTVKKYTDIPVSIGIANTKTLAKAANKIAKSKLNFNGVFNFFDVNDITPYLQELDIADIWGIGNKYAKFLNKNGIYRAEQLLNLSDAWIKKNLTINGLRTVTELRGTPCIEDEFTVQSKKNICCSRSFGKDVNSYDYLREAIVSYATSAAEKMRKQNSSALSVLVFITTNRFKEVRQYSNSIAIPFSEATSYTPDIINNALKCLKLIYKKGYYYKKAGVILLDIIPDTKIQPKLFTNEKLKEEKNNLSKTLDIINRKYGKNTLKFAGSGLKQEWKMKQDKLSKSYTTKWSDIPIVKS